MKTGIFLPVGSRGWLMSTTSPPTRPTFDLNNAVIQRAEHYGFDFALAMVKLRGFSGPSRFWTESLEPFTICSALAAVTRRIKIYTSVPVLAIPPAVTARMAATMDSIAPGRIGINIVTGWQPKEYQQMGLWPGDNHYADRYSYASEYIQIVKELWQNGHSNFRGCHFAMDDCQMLPTPSHKIDIVGAGQSDRGIQFVAQHGDYSFVGCEGLNSPQAAKGVVDRVVQAGRLTGRNVKPLLLVMLITDRTDQLAMDKWRKYVEGTDMEALRWQTRQAGQDRGAQSGSTSFNLAKALEDPMPAGMLKLIGSFESVAKQLDEIAAFEGLGGVILTFDEFIIGMEQFGESVLPLMKSRRGKISEYHQVRG